MKHSRISIFHIILDHNQKYDRFPFSFRSSSFVRCLDKEGYYHRNIIIRHEHILFKEKPGILEPARTNYSI